jgi:hypothetical protein
MTNEVAPRAGAWIETLHYFYSLSLRSGLALRSLLKKKMFAVVTF